MITLVAGTRPNFMKVAPICRELLLRGLPLRLVHTGQHFDASMSDVFFRDLGMPEPHAKFEGTSGSHAEQTASILVAMERELVAHRPKVVVVVGDVTSTLSAALAASKLGIGVVHVEAGLRSNDWTMPEEINRVLTDQLSDLLLIPSDDARPNLLREGIAEERIVFVGNVMIDSLQYASKRPTDALSRLGLSEHGYALATLHRPANVDTKEGFLRVIDSLEALGSHVSTIFPVHPRTIARAGSLGLEDRLRGLAGVRIVEPLGYNDFVTLMSRAALVATDSGGIQEETTALGIPCLTLREGTERPITVTEGTNVIVGTDPTRIRQETKRALEKGRSQRPPPRGWDGRAATRIVDALERFVAGTPKPKSEGPRA